MLLVLSPAKTLDYDSAPTTTTFTMPGFVPDSAVLIERLRQFSPAEISSLMGISDPLAVLNTNRFAAWSTDFTFANSKQAVLAFNGDVYEGLDAPSLSAAELAFAQKHLRILSGLYGMLRPLDLMQPYRLEMGTKLATTRGKDLYVFWGERITQALNADLLEQGATALVNLASDEYFKVVRPALLRAPLITPVFEEWKGGKYKIISFYAKRARGLMARFAINNQITQPADLEAFDAEGYAFDANASSDKRWVFRRKLAS